MERHNGIGYCRRLRMMVFGSDEMMFPRWAALAVVGAGLLSGCSKKVEQPVGLAVLPTTEITEQLISAPEEIAGETPESLARQGAALIVARGYGDHTTTGAFESSGPSTRRAALMSLSMPGSSSSVVWITGEDSRKPDRLGWGVAVARPGTYVLDAMVTDQNEPALQRKGDATAGEERAIELHPGEVVYIGTLHYTAAGRRAKLAVDDESAAAHSFLKQRLPAFADHLTTRLLGCNCAGDKLFEPVLPAAYESTPSPASGQSG